MKLKVRVLIIAILSIVLLSCDSKKSPSGYQYPDLDPTTRGALLEYSKVKTMSKSQVQSLLQNTADSFEGEEGDDGLNIFTILGQLNNGVTIYRLFYSSEVSDDPVVLSGLILIPDTDTAVAHYQYHHGSLMPFEIKDEGGLLDAPSLFDGKEPKGKKEQVETMLFALIQASNGYFVSAPDYPGYGISQHLEHPYAYPPDLARTSADMLMAARDFANNLSVQLSDKTFLCGVSEGGLVSLVTHRLIDNEYPQLNITASANYAGPYNLSRFFQEFITAADQLDALNLYNWALYTFWKRNKNLFTDKIWTYEVNDQQEAINVPSNLPSDIYTEYFINIARSDTGQLVEEINKIEVYRNWNHQGKIYLHHGKADQTVPVYNTNDAYQYLQQQGADVEKYLYEGNHYTAIFNFFTNMIIDFSHMDRMQYFVGTLNK